MASDRAADGRQSLRAAVRRHGVISERPHLVAQSATSRAKFVHCRGHAPIVWRNEYLDPRGRIVAACATTPCSRPCVAPTKHAPAALRSSCPATRPPAPMAPTGDPPPRSRGEGGRPRL